MAGAIGSNPKTGWAGESRDGQWAIAPRPSRCAAPVKREAGGTRWTIRLEQNFGQHHTLGRFRLSLGQAAVTAECAAAWKRGGTRCASGISNAWLAAETPKAVKWTVLRPASMKANVPLLNLLPDGSVLASGDKTKRDVYDLNSTAPPCAA